MGPAGRVCQHVLWQGVGIQGVSQKLTEGLKKGALLLSSLLLLSFVSLSLTEPGIIAYEFLLGSLLFLFAGHKLSDKSNAVLLFLFYAALIFKLVTIYREING